MTDQDKKEQERKKLENDWFEDKKKKIEKLIE